MIQTIPMNIDAVIFDSLTAQRKTINGIPAGYLSPNYPRIVGADNKPQPVDVAKIVEHFHKKEGEEALACSYTGMVSDGVNVVDGNPQNFLVTNLEPVSKGALDQIPFMPKGSVTRVLQTPDHDLEIKLYGVPFFRAQDTLDKLTVPEVPSELGLAYDELQLLYIWNELTKVQLLKGLSSLTKRNRQTGVSAEITNASVMEFTYRALHFDIKDTEENE